MRKSTDGARCLITLLGKKNKKKNSDAFFKENKDVRVCSCGGMLQGGRRAGQDRAVNRCMMGWESREEPRVVVRRQVGSGSV